MENASLIWSLGAWNWLIFGGLLILLELVVPGFFLLFIGVAAVAVGVVALNFEMAWQIQWLLFSAFSAAGVLVARSFWMSNEPAADQPHLNNPVEKLIGQSFVVVEEFQNGSGKIQVADTRWIAKGADMPVGTNVTVVKTDGTQIFVEQKA